MGKKFFVVLMVLGLVALPFAATAQEDDYSWLYEEEDVDVDDNEVYYDETDVYTDGDDVIVMEEEVAVPVITAFPGFDVYTEKFSRNNHYIPSGWMGDYGDIKFDGGSTEDPYLGETCIFHSC